MKVVNGWKEYAVGEKLVLDGVEYLCIPRINCCVGCSFFAGSNYTLFHCPPNVSCSKNNRSDGEGIIFKRLEKYQEPKKKTEFAVGEEFRCGLKTLKCIAVDANSPKITCEGCVFCDGLDCRDYLDFSGFCREKNRSDATEVIFIEVKPENKEK